MKQIVRFEVYLFDDEQPVIAVKPTHLFESFFEFKDDSNKKEMDEAIFDFELKVRSFVLSCQDLFKSVSVNKVVKIVDYGF